MKSIPAPTPVTMFTILVCGAGLVLAKIISAAYGGFMVVMMNTPVISHILKYTILH